jgi:hypothetical protein
MAIGSKLDNNRKRPRFQYVDWTLVVFWNELPISPSPFAHEGLRSMPTFPPVRASERTAHRRQLGIAVQRIESAETSKRVHPPILPRDILLRFGHINVGFKKTRLMLGAGNCQPDVVCVDFQNGDVSLLTNNNALSFPSGNDFHFVASSLS